jgi:hypothetical protein
MGKQVVSTRTVSIILNFVSPSDDEASILMGTMLVIVAIVMWSRSMANDYMSYEPLRPTIQRISKRGGVVLCVFWSGSWGRRGGRRGGLLGGTRKGRIYGEVIESD